MSICNVFVIDMIKCRRTLKNIPKPNLFLKKGSFMFINPVNLSLEESIVSI